MKKIFTLIAMVCGFVASASAQITVTNHGKEVGRNEVLTYNLAYDDFLAEVVGYDELEPAFNNTSDETVTLKVRLTPDANSRNGQLSWCGVTSACTPVVLTGNATYEERSIDVLGGDQKAMALHTLFQEGEYHTSTCNVQVYADDQFVTNFIMKFVYDETTQGINNVESAAASVKVSDNVLTYAFATAGNHNVKLYSTDGKLVKSVATAAQSGSISLAGLQHGIYVCNADGNATKVMVK